MSNEAITWAYRQAVGAGAKFVLVALADMADEEHSCYPGQAKLAQMTGQGERTVRRHLAELEEGGFLTRTRRFNAQGFRTSDRYVLPVSRPTGQTGQRPKGPKAKRDALAANDSGLTGQGGQVTQREPSDEPSLSLVTSDGDRNETLPASNTPTQRQRCKKHRNGNPTNENCRECRADRIADEVAVAEDKREAEQRKANCRDCHGTGWKEHPNSGLPAGKCTTHLWRTA